MTQQNLVLGLVAENENQALEVAARAYSTMLYKAGYRYEVLDLYQTAGFERLTQALQSGEVAYVYGLAGVGSALPTATGENLWTATRTPFLSLWYDPPCYNYRQHCIDSPYVANLYHVRDHFEAAQNWLPQTRSSRRLLRPPCIINKSHRYTPFKERSQRILFAKPSSRSPTGPMPGPRSHVPCKTFFMPLPTRRRKIRISIFLAKPRFTFRKPGWIEAIWMFFLALFRKSMAMSALGAAKN